jgi:tRNA G18 (ribose-2'-O)-methylase SpoU
MKKKKTDELNRHDLKSYLKSNKVPVWIILENIRSAHNVGSFFRTADAFGIEGISLCGYCARPPHTQLDKVALGATESVEWIGFDNGEEAILDAKGKGYLVLAIEQVHEAESLEKIPNPEMGIALVFGNEVSGVDEKTLSSCDGAIEVPQFGIKHSLNVSVCGGAVLWEASKKYRFK